MKKIFILSCLLTSTYAVSAQSSGLRFDSAAYRVLAQKSNLHKGSSGSRGKISTPEHSLKPFCPEAGFQKNASCVGWAIGYGAMTILRAKQFGITNAAEITQLAHSASYIYNQIASSNTSGAYPETAFELLKNKGICRDRTFSSLTQFDGKPSEIANEEAKRFQIDTFFAVWMPDSSAEFHLDQLKRTLLANLPMVLCIKGSALFKPCGDSLQTHPNDTTAHALCLIGFDDSNPKDSTFEVLNSWGKCWGNNGFKKINQRELIPIIMGAYAMKLPAVANHIRTNEVVFKRFRQQQWQEEAMTFDAKRFPTYQVQKTSFDEKTLFELTLLELHAGQYVYIFGKDPQRQWIDYEQIVAERNLVEIKKRFEFTQKGSEMLFLLFSKEAIIDFKTRFEKVKNAKKTTSELNQIKAGFADLLQDEAIFEYLPQRVGVIYPKDKAVIVGFSLEAY